MLIMPQCPRCPKTFADASHVVMHLNQPVSACLAYHQEVEQKNNLKASAAHAHDLPSPSITMVDYDDPPTQDLGAIANADDVVSNLITSMDVDDAELHISGPNSISNSPFLEMYPGAAQTFGHGKTLMDIFDADCHADQRTQFPYYPFASKAEWDLASFLLRSDLSMNSIDKFLKLELVSDLFAMPFLITGKSDKNTRLRSSVFLFDLQRIFAIVQKCYQKDLNGSVCQLRRSI